MKNIFFLIILLSSFNLLANEKANNPLDDQFPRPLQPEFAKVLLVKGEVSQLVLGAERASWVKKGDFIRKHSSVLTRKKSFIRMKLLSDGSIINLGPDSKILLSDMDRKGGTVIGHLKGLLKAEVEEKKKKELSLIIKTRNTVMGVRGTKFVSVTNPNNGITTLVTLKGEVQIVKTKGSVPAKNLVEKLQIGKGVVVEKGNVSTSTLSQGSTAASAEKLKVFKMNPVQLVSLHDDKIFNVKVDELEKEHKRNVEEGSTQNKELYADAKNNIAKGGFVDYSSAIFIPPTDDQTADLGGIDKETGVYVPAKGVYLDPKKGFFAEKGNKLAFLDANKLNAITGFSTIEPEVAGLKIIADDHLIGRFVYGLDFLLDFNKSKINKQSDENQTANLDGNVGTGIGLVGAYYYDEKLLFKGEIVSRFASSNRGGLEADPRHDDDRFAFGARFETTYFFNEYIGARFDVRYEQDLVLIAATTDQVDSFASTYAVWVPKVGGSLVWRINYRFDTEVGYLRFADSSPDNFASGSGHQIHSALIYYLRNDHAKHIRFGIDRTTHNYGNVRNRWTGLSLNYNLMFF